MGMTVNGAWPSEQAVNPVLTEGSTQNLMGFRGEVFTNTMILYMYTAQEQGEITLSE